MPDGQPQKEGAAAKNAPDCNKVGKAYSSDYTGDGPTERKRARKAQPQKENKTSVRSPTHSSSTDSIAKKPPHHRLQLTFPDGVGTVRTIDDEEGTFEFSGIEGQFTHDKAYIKITNINQKGKNRYTIVDVTADIMTRDDK